MNEPDTHFRTPGGYMMHAVPDLFVKGEVKTSPHIEEVTCPTCLHNLNYVQYLNPPEQP